MSRHVIGARGRILQMTDLVPADLEREAIAWRRHLHAQPRAVVRGGGHVPVRRGDAALVRRSRARAADGDERRRDAARRRGRGRCWRCGPTWTRCRSRRRPGSSSPRRGPASCTRAGTTGTRRCCSGAAKLLAARRDELAGEVRFVFQHAEEKPPGGARQLVDAGVMDGVDLVVGAHLALDQGGGKVACRPGPIDGRRGRRLLGRDPRPRRARGDAAPDRRPGRRRRAGRDEPPAPRLARRSTRSRSAVVSRDAVPRRDGRNIIAESVELGGTVRTFDPEVREASARGSNGSSAASPRRTARRTRSSTRTATPPSSTTRPPPGSCRGAGGARRGAIMRLDPIMGGEDFSAYLGGRPARSSGSAPGARTRRSRTTTRASRSTSPRSARGSPCSCGRPSTT